MKSEYSMWRLRKEIRVIVASVRVPNTPSYEGLYASDTLVGTPFGPGVGHVMETTSPHVRDEIQVSPECIVVD